MSTKQRAAVGLGICVLVLGAWVGLRIWRGARVMTAAAEAMKRLKTPVRAGELQRTPMTRRYLPDDLHEVISSLSQERDPVAIRAALAPHAAAVAAVRRAAERLDEDWAEGAEGLDSPQPSYADVMSTVPPLHYRSVRSTTQLFVIVSRLVAAEGRRDEAASKGSEAAVLFDVEAMQREVDECLPSPTTYRMPALEAAPICEAASRRLADVTRVGLTDVVRFLIDPGTVVHRRMMQVSVPSAGRALLQEARARARLRGALVAWHLAAHRSREGRLPATLAACDPPIPVEMMEDPVAGGRLRYEVVDGRATLSAGDEPARGSEEPGRLALLPPADKAPPDRR